MDRSVSSRSFSLTHPDPPKVQALGMQPSRYYGTYDPRDYANEALTNWLDAQLASHDLDDALAESSTVGQRLIDGDHWVREHGPSNPDWERAQRLHVKLHNRQKELLGIIKFRYVRLWLRCCAVFGCLNLIDDPDGWIATHAPGRFTNDPKAIWHALQPERTPPFQSFPPNEAWYVGGAFETQDQLDVWVSRKESS